MMDISKMDIEDIKTLVGDLISTNISTKTLTGSTPQIIDGAGYWTGAAGGILVLWKNAGGYGWNRIQAYNQDTNTLVGSFDGCYYPILPLGYINLFPTSSLFTFATAKTYYCPIGATENCTSSPPTCSSPNPSSTWTDIVVYNYDGTTPGQPPSLNIQNQDRGLGISWGVSSSGGNPGAALFAYQVLVQGADKTVNGYVPASLRNVSIGGLTNGFTYNVSVYAITKSNRYSTAAIGTGTPTPPCPAISGATLTFA